MKGCLLQKIIGARSYGVSPVTQTANQSLPNAAWSSLAILGLAWVYGFFSFLFFYFSIFYSIY
jgi:hypothetical protein